MKAWTHTFKWGFSLDTKWLPAQAGGCTHRKAGAGPGAKYFGTCRKIPPFAEYYEKRGKE